MHDEYETISHQEFTQLLVGISGDTPLGYTVHIRSETDQKKIQEMTNKEKEIRRKWAEFKNNNTQKKTFVSKENIDKVFSKIFR